ncbi:Rid family detoxifying hydrolase [Aquimarina brevivitae]|uniref:2-iminobutanoate/2-iminopropanoate deaminase n=1 Tax=Aquimarina brevivitae TaxID=323412 RepID=A0A4Q7NWG4_9FLAO|nr:Rid family detoxifying hydrolase [Aquimarina brevivitae]RZS90742.1 2-iminobutanoate/2-iminopropanoate deaminase [Aquimarina brevivitae]
MKTIITTTKAPAPIGPYSQAILSGNTLYTSGQIALDPDSGKLIMDSIAMETDQVMKNLKAILDEVGMTFENVIKSTIFLSDMNNFEAVNKVYGSYLNEDTAPARETVAVKTLPKSVNVEISMIAVK